MYNSNALSQILPSVPLGMRRTLAVAVMLIDKLLVTQKGCDKGSGREWYWRSVFFRYGYYYSATAIGVRLYQDGSYGYGYYESAKATGVRLS